MNRNPKSKEFGRRAGRFGGKSWTAAIMGFAAFGVAGMIWLGKVFEIQLPLKPAAPAFGSAHGPGKPYWLSGRWRADAHTLVCVVEYLFRPERPGTNGPTGPVATQPFPARTNAETAMVIRGDAIVRA